MDYTHSNTGQESQTKTVSSATAEEIQGLTSNPENFLFRDHRKFTECASQCGMEMPQIRTAKLCRELGVTLVTGSSVGIYFTVQYIFTVYFTAIWQALQEHDGKN